MLNNPYFLSSSLVDLCIAVLVAPKKNVVMSQQEILKAGLQQESVVLNDFAGSCINIGICNYTRKFIFKIKCLITSSKESS